MPMCVIVTRDVPARFRGFLASCMLEIAPGVYTQPGHVCVCPRAGVDRIERLVGLLLPGGGRHDVGLTKRADAPACINAGRTHQGFDRVRRAIRRQAGTAELKI